MSSDPETSSLFRTSNFDAYDSGEDRSSAVLRAGLDQHGLVLADVAAVTQDMGLWAVCRPGLFYGTLRGLFKKRIEIGPLIPWAHVDSVREEPSGPHTMRIVVQGVDGKTVARIDFSAAGMHNTPEQAAAHRRTFLETLLRFV